MYSEEQVNNMYRAFASIHASNFKRELEDYMKSERDADTEDARDMKQQIIEGDDKLIASQMAASAIVMHVSKCIQIAIREGYTRESFAMFRKEIEDLVSANEKDKGHVWRTNEDLT